VAVTRWATTHTLARLHSRPNFVSAQIIRVPFMRVPFMRVPFMRVPFMRVPWRVALIEALSL
jgi:hypothetical protein